MTELEQLRADLATLEAALNVQGTDRGFNQFTRMEIIKVQDKIADLEAQQIQSGEWTSVKLAGETDSFRGMTGNGVMWKYVRHLEVKVADLYEPQEQVDPWKRAKEALFQWDQNDREPDHITKRSIFAYVQNLQAKVDELNNELRCERIDGGKVRDDRKARIAEPVINDMRALKTAQQILATYKHLHDESTQKEINQAIGTLRQMAGTQAVAYKFDPTPDICPINQDDLREKLAELTTIANAISPACGLARELVQKRIDGVKKEMQGRNTTFRDSSKIY